MSYRNELTSLLCLPQNINATLDIEEVIWEVKPRLQRCFWESVRIRLDADLRTEKIKDQWYSRSVPGCDLVKQPTKNDAGIRCILRTTAERTPRLHATLGVWDGGLYTGVGFVETRPKDVPPEIGCLSRILEQERFRLPSVPKAVQRCR